MNKGDYTVNPDEITETAPPDFCALGKHSYEIRVGDAGLERHCNDCGQTEDVVPEECVDGELNWRPEHDFHFGVCRNCGEDGDGAY